LSVGFATLRTIRNLDAIDDRDAVGMSAASQSRRLTVAERRSTLTLAAPERYPRRSMTTRPARIWIDVSPLRKCPSQPTGIPRVLVSLARELARLDRSDLRFCVIEGQRALRPIRIESLLARFARSSPAEVETPLESRGFVERIGRGLARRWIAHGPLSLVAPNRAVDLGPDDMLLSLGGGWTTDPDARFYRRLQDETGIRTAHLLFDMIPIVRPDFFPPRTHEVFAPWLREMTALSDRVFVISRRTERDFVDFCERENLPTPDIDIVRLGDELRPDGGAAMWPAELPTDRPFVLAVGTVEIRKNHGLLVDVWRRLESPPLLVIAGRDGWLADLDGRLDAESAVRSHVIRLRDVNDAQLGRLYDASLFTVYPSRYEGWGLPVAESLARGKICVASDATSIPEIAPTLTELCDPRDVAAWTATIRRFAFDDEGRRRREAQIRAEYRCTSWSETVKEILLPLPALGERVGVRGPPSPRVVG
jgi:glycosyltransferase involved in cell wall biosynthesis